MANIIRSIRQFISERFNLKKDKANEGQIIDSITRDVNFQGANLWTLIFAIFIASIGLNVNSTAVVIGAMLISPLMGPIMGIGLGIGINDFDLFKRGLKNLLIAAIFSIITSFLYFKISPLRDTSSELLARTTPSIWDVFIAFFGGLAGIVAGTRKEKSNVVPGVAIATALMPPLCTAGYGLATGKMPYFLGAVYLFFINGLFICFATFLIVKHLGFQKVALQTKEMEKKVSRYIFIIVIVTVVPSIYLAYRIVKKSIFETNATTFIKQQFHFAQTQVVKHTYVFDGTQHTIELLLIGQPISKDEIDTIRGRMPQYSLYNTRLVVYQGLDAKQKIDLAEIKASVLEEINFKNKVTDTLAKIDSSGYLPDIKNEISVLFPGIKAYDLTRSKAVRMDSIPTRNEVLFVGKFAPHLSIHEKNRLTMWLKYRLKVDTVHTVAE